jgi:proton-dependent oligopeptide transporter, POT family
MLSLFSATRSLPDRSEVQNFISEPLPDGSTTGAGGADGQSGALGLGQRAATGLTLFNQFWAYFMPMLGGYLADTYLGKFNTINVAM